MWGNHRPTGTVLLYAVVLFSPLILCGALRSEPSGGALGVEQPASCSSQNVDDSLVRDLARWENTVAMHSAHHEPECIPAGPGEIGRTVTLPKIDMPEYAQYYPNSFHAGEFHRGILLPNCMTVHLISVVKPSYSRQPPTAAAYITFPFGYAFDSPDIRGLSHLVEHMILHGSKNFPDGNALESLLIYRNGKTSLRRTQYQIETDLKYFRTVLNAFTDVLTQPSLLSNFIYNEVNSVNSEYIKDSVNDTTKHSRLLMHLSDSEHPAHDSVWGNSETILEHYDSDPQGLRDRAAEFHAKHYTANGASAVLVAPHGLDYLQFLAERYFGRLPSFKLEPPWKGRLTFPPKMLPMKVCVVPTDPIETIQMVFPLHFNDTSSRKIFDTLSPWTYIPLRHREDGSLTDALWKEGLIKESGFRVSHTEETHSAHLWMILTKAGAKRKEDILKYTFGYLKMLRRNGIPYYLMEERQRKRNFSWHVYRKADLERLIQIGSESPMLVAEKAAEATASLDSKFWYAGMEGFGEWIRKINSEQETLTSIMKRRLYLDVNGKFPHYGGLNKTSYNIEKADVGPQVVELVEICLSMLNPRNVVIMERSKSCADSADQDEPFFHTKFSKRKLDESYIQELEAASPIEGMKVPSPNPWIPRRVFELRAPNTAYEIDRRWKVRVYTTEDMFDFAYGHISVYLISDQFPRSSGPNDFMYRLMTRVMKDTCRRGDLYRANLAGYSCDGIELSPRHLRFKLTGHSNNLTDFTLAVLDRFNDLDKVSDEMVLWHIASLRAEEYSNLRQPVDQAVENLDVALDESKESPWGYRAIGHLISPYRFKIFVHDIVATIYQRKKRGTSWFQRLTSFMFPSFFRAQGAIEMKMNAPSVVLKKFVEDVRERYKFDVGRGVSSGLKLSRFVLPAQKIVRLRVASGRPQDVSYGVCFRLQFVYESFQKLSQLRSVLFGLVEPLRVDYAKRLRAEKQLGYMVTMRHNLNDVMVARGDQPVHVDFTVQSEDHKPPELLEHVEEFLMYFEKDRLPLLSFELFNSHAKRGTGSASAAFNLPLVQDFWSTYISQGGPKRRAAVSEVWRRDSEMPRSDAANLEHEFVTPLQMRSKLERMKRVVQ